MTYHKLLNIVAVVICLPPAQLLAAPPQDDIDAVGRRRLLVTNIRWALPRQNPSTRPPYVADLPRPFQTASTISGGRRSTTRKILGGAAGGVGGFFGGAFLGAAIEGDRCNCDDPGFVGFWVGAPIGAVVGAIVGAKWF